MDLLDDNHVIGKHKLAIHQPSGSRNIPEFGDQWRQRACF